MMSRVPNTARDVVAMMVLAWGLSLFKVTRLCLRSTLHRVSLQQYDSIKPGWLASRFTGILNLRRIITTLEYVYLRSI